VSWHPQPHWGPLTDSLAPFRLLRSLEGWEVGEGGVTRHEAAHYRAVPRDCLERAQAAQPHGLPRRVRDGQTRLVFPAMHTYVADTRSTARSTASSHGRRAATAVITRAPRPSATSTSSCATALVRAALPQRSKGSSGGLHCGRRSSCRQAPQPLGCAWLSPSATRARSAEAPPWSGAPRQHARPERTRQGPCRCACSRCWRAHQLTLPPCALPPRQWVAPERRRARTLFRRTPAGPLPDPCHGVWLMLSDTFCNLINGARATSERLAKLAVEGRWKSFNIHCLGEYQPGPPERAGAARQ
jgi:hypothetical protein